MALLTWKPEFDLDVPEMDRQHRQLVAIINRLHDAMLAGSPAAEMQRILGDLVSYTRFHFTAEEEMMRRAAFPGLKPHQLVHQALLEKVGDFQQQFASGKVALSIPLMNFLKDWLARHILETDKKYSPKAATPAPALASRG